jgi:hypothetical protein
VGFVHTVLVDMRARLAGSERPEVLSESDQRLDFLRSALDAAPSTTEEFEELHRIHADVLPTLNSA